MSRKFLIAAVVGMFVAALGGVASAEAPNYEPGSSDAAVRQWAADPESAVGQGESWQERGPVETGSMYSPRGNSPELRCCEGDSGPMLDQAGETVPRPGIDDGP